MVDLKALIIDDEAWTRDTIKRIGNWREFGYRIVGEANDGIFGLKCIRQLQPDLVITDMRMPGLDGAQMLKELQTQTPSPKVIVVSGYSDYTYTRQALAFHAVDYLLKPIDAEEFNAILRQCALVLRAQQTEKRPAAGFDGLQNVSRDWLRDYQNARDRAYKSFDSQSSAGFREACHQMKELYCASEVTSRHGILIKINYDLYSFLEEQIITWNTNENRCFGPELTSMAIGENVPIEDLLEHYSAIVKELISSQISQNQQAHRIDLRPLIHYIENHFHETISLQDLSQRFSISKEYLCAVFKKEQGCTLTEYLTRIRMNKARELITHYQLPLKSIPEMVGYIDVSHFYKTFKRYFGVTPGTFRRQNAGDSNE